MKKPDRQVQISGHSYTIKEVDDLKTDDGDALWGLYRPGLREILIDAALPAVTKRQTLLHEIVHGIMEHAGLREYPGDEQVATALAYGLESVRLDGKPILRR